MVLRFKQLLENIQIKNMADNNRNNLTPQEELNLFRSDLIKPAELSDLKKFTEANKMVRGTAPFIKKVI